jgi:hypothetical protein
LVTKGENVTKRIGVSASAILCVCARLGCAQPPERLAWPPELPGATIYVSGRSNVVLDEGNSRDELAISMIQNAPHPAVAAAWIEFIRTDSATAVYQRYGFDYATAEERGRREQK